jgi:hypothetical protein
MAIGYKYAERNADSQVNWAEVGKGLSDMLAETNRVRQEKKDALDTAQRETMNYLAETPNGEHVGARESILEYANMSSNQMRVMKQLMEQGQLDVKDYTIFRQNLTDNTNLAFNANKLYQEKYSDVMKGVADKKYSQLYADNFAEVEGFGDWRNIGWQIAPNGVVMAGKMVEEEVDGKKVRTLDKTPGALRSMDYLNQSLVSQVDFYQYEDKVNAWVETLGKEKTITEIDLGGIQRKGKITTKEDITSREDLSPGTKDVLYTFLQGENDQIASIVGDPLDASRVLVDSAIFAPNGQQYGTTTSEEEAKKNPNLILKVVNPDTGGFKYVISKQQQEDANEFVRGQMRSKYNYEESAEAVGATARDESAMQKERAAAAFRPKPENKDKEADDATSMIGKLYYGDDNQVKSAIDYFKGIKGKDGKILFKEIVRNGNSGVTVTLANGSKENISFIDADGRPRTQEDFIASAGPLLANELDVSSSLKRGAYEKGASFNKSSKGKGATVERFTLETDALSDSSQRAYEKIQAGLPQGFTAEDTGSIIPGSGRLNNQVTITAPNGKKYTVATKISGDKAINAAIAVEKFVTANSPKQTENEVNTTVSGGRTR